MEKNENVEKWGIAWEMLMETWNQSPDKSWKIK
jgi:hypothetical protein